MLPPKPNGLIACNWGCGEVGRRKLRTASSPPLPPSPPRSINVPLLVLWVLAADDVHVALALPPHALSLPSAFQFLARSLSCPLPTRRACRRRTYLAPVAQLLDAAAHLHPADLLLEERCRGRRERRAGGQAPNREGARLRLRGGGGEARHGGGRREKGPPERDEEGAGEHGCGELAARWWWCGGCCGKRRAVMRVIGTSAEFGTEGCWIGFGVRLCQRCFLRGRGGR